MQLKRSQEAEGDRREASDGLQSQQTNLERFLDLMKDPGRVPNFASSTDESDRKAPLAFNMRVLPSSANVLRPFRPDDVRPYLAGHEEDEYNKNVVYGEYLWDESKPNSDPTLMSRLLRELEFRTDEKEPQPFRIVLGTVHRNVQSIGPTQALLKLMSAMSKMARLCTQMTKPDFSIQSITNISQYVLQEEVPEDVDYVADTMMQITPKHRRMWMFRDDL